MSNGNHHIAHIDQSKWRVSNYEIILGILKNYELQISSLTDYGCGYGSLLKAAENVFKIDQLLGYDAEWIQKDHFLLKSHNFITVDLSNPKLIPRSNADLVTSIEVAEHLPDEAGRVLIKRMTESSNFIIFSAAVPGQRGFGHINLQWQSYWGDIFKRHKFDIYDIFRPILCGNKSMPFWLRQNLFLYVRQGYAPIALEGKKIDSSFQDFFHKSFKFED